MNIRCSSRPSCWPGCPSWWSCSGRSAPGGPCSSGSSAGYLFLPNGQVKLGLAGFAFPIDKRNVTGLGLILGVLIFDRRTLLQARPGWLDLPMAAYYLAPLIGLATGVPGSSVDILDVMIGRGLGWVVPYAMGRIYFAGGTGRSRSPSLW